MCDKFSLFFFSLFYVRSFLTINAILKRQPAQQKSRLLILSWQKKKRKEKQSFLALVFMFMLFLFHSISFCLFIRFGSSILTSVYCIHYSPLMKLWYFHFLYMLPGIILEIYNTIYTFLYTTYIDICVMCIS